MFKSLPLAGKSIHLFTHLVNSTCPSRFYSNVTYFIKLFLTHPGVISNSNNYSAFRCEPLSVRAYVPLCYGNYLCVWHLCSFPHDISLNSHNYHIMLSSRIPILQMSKLWAGTCHPAHTSY